MTNDLVTTFTKGNGKNHRWTYKNIDTTLPAHEIKEACELLTTLNIFEQDGVKLFDTVVTAKIVTKKETVIFDKHSENGASERPAACFPGADTLPYLATSKAVRKAISEPVPQTVPVTAKRAPKPVFPTVTLTDGSDNQVNQQSLIIKAPSIGATHKNVGQFPTVSGSKPYEASSNQVTPSQSKPRKRLLNRLFHKSKQQE
ncbi:MULTISPECIES: DUF2922 family protein [unclassified Enterococcus]|uniref:DUF2922 family protein n=1 Tax=unclassified Enterococcus TaxID=2608891 RepID=UPI000B6E1FC6|nr:MULTISPECIES: DUF2922 family protein [unclassified Enterococcus]OTO72712.1 hypothetical protein A5865_001667 [Enterococcus sp. 12E11_DIV0728]OUZ14168.1 hypothetical protein A5868_003191 [Enterococcus sp. 12F9_DIV0723]